MPADSLVHVRGLDPRETLIEAAAVLATATQEPDFLDRLSGIYQPSQVDEILSFFSLRMPSIVDGSLEVPSDYLLGECLKVVEASDPREVPLAAALMSLNLYSLGRLGPVADVAVKSLWPKIWGPIAQFLRSVCEEVRDDVDELDSPNPPVMEDLDCNFSWNPHDPCLLGDYTMWARGTGPLFHSLGGWDSAWTMPQRPATDTGESSWKSWDHEAQIAYWTPLAQLVVGPLGWTDPAVGVARWVLRGTPTAEPELRFLSQVWGVDALMFFCTTNDWVPHMNQEVGIFRAGVGPAERIYSSTWRKQQLIGSGEYHLSQHLMWQMFGETWSEASHRQRYARVFKPDDQRRDEAILMLERFAGWYRNLELHGPDGLKVHVIAPPVGYLGKFRRDPQTRRWHRTSTQVHRWGN